jgi:hypothetical protein
MAQINLPMSDKRYDTISARVRQSYPNSCILWIDEIDNAVQIHEHDKLFEEISQKRPANTVKKLELFHGTAETNIAPIIQDGFQVKYNKIGAYGKGTYFSTVANYSIAYAKDGRDKISYMFLCSVITGIAGRYGSMQEINTTEHDNAVDNHNHPSIYVTPYDYGAIPKYIIAFYKHATN